MSSVMCFGDEAAFGWFVRNHKSVAVVKPAALPWESAFPSTLKNSLAKVPVDLCVVDQSILARLVDKTVSYEDVVVLHRGVLVAKVPPVRLEADGNKRVILMFTDSQFLAREENEHVNEVVRNVQRALLSRAGEESESDDADDAVIDIATARNILGVRASSTKKEIRGAYVAAIALYHPDKVQLLGQKLKLVAESESRRINAAYDLLQRRHSAAERAGMTDG